MQLSSIRNSVTSYGLELFISVYKNVMLNLIKILLLVQPILFVHLVAISHFTLVAIIEEFIGFASHYYYNYILILI